VIDVEPLIREELTRRFRLVDPAIACWPDVLHRSGETRRRRRRRLTATAITGAAVVALALSPLGGAVTRAVGGFSDWLRGTPGTQTSPAVQQQFDAARFPGKPRLRELLQVTLDGQRFVLYGFTTREVVCLRLAVPALGTGPETACVPRAELRRTHDLVLPVKGNLTVWPVGRRRRSGHERPPIPRYVVTFGLAARQVTSVSVVTDRGASRAVLRSGAFLHVFRAGGGNVSARTVIAGTVSRRTGVVQLSVASSREQPHTGLRPHGPSRVTRTVSGGTIGWFVRRELRGLSPTQAHFSLPGCCHGYTRLIQPDPDDFLRMLISDHDPSPHPHPTHVPIPSPKPGEHRICLGAVTHGGVGWSCTTLENLFGEGPLALSWGFSGAGQQLWLVEGLASDDVARIEVFLGTGEHWRVPLRDNVTLFRVQRSKFPLRVVAYDVRGRVISVRTIRG